MQSVTSSTRSHARTRLRELGYAHDAMTVPLWADVLAGIEFTELVPYAQWFDIWLYAQVHPEWCAALEAVSALAQVQSRATNRSRPAGRTIADWIISTLFQDEASGFFGEAVARLKAFEGL